MNELRKASKRVSQGHLVDLHQSSKSNAKGRAMRTRQSYLGRSVPLAMIVNINEGRVNSVKMYREENDSASELFRPYDSASKILQIKNPLKYTASLLKNFTLNNCTKIQFYKNFMKPKTLVFYDISNFYSIHYHNLNDYKLASPIFL